MKVYNFSVLESAEWQMRYYIHFSVFITITCFWVVCDALCISFISSNYKMQFWTLCLIYVILFIPYMHDSFQTFSDTFHFIIRFDFSCPTYQNAFLTIFLYLFSWSRNLHWWFILSILVILLFEFVPFFINQRGII